MHSIPYEQGRIIGAFSTDTSLVYKYVFQINAYYSSGPQVLVRTAEGWQGITDNIMNSCIGHTFMIKMRYESGNLYVRISSSSGLLYEENFPNITILKEDYPILTLTGDLEFLKGECNVTYEFLTIRN